MPIQVADDPPILFRIGRYPHPLAWPPVLVGGDGRYDDPAKRASVLYAATARRTIFMETLDQYRVDIATQGAMELANVNATDSPSIEVGGVIPPNYFTRGIVTFSLEPGQHWLDVRSPQTHVVLRRDLAPHLRALGHGSRFVLGDLLAHDHAVTQLERFA